MLNITLVKMDELVDLFRCTVADMYHKRHTVEMKKSVLDVLPLKFRRGSDTEHIGIIAAGTVLLSNDSEIRFHKADDSMVNRAYEAASKSQILGGLKN